MTRALPDAGSALVIVEPPIGFEPMTETRVGEPDSPTLALAGHVRALGRERDVWHGGNPLALPGEMRGAAPIAIDTIDMMLHVQREILIGEVREFDDETNRRSHELLASIRAERNQAAAAGGASCPARSPAAH